MQLYGNCITIFRLAGVVPGMGLTHYGYDQTADLCGWGLEIYIYALNE